MNDNSKLTVYTNPFFDEILVFLDNLPSSSDKLKPIDPDNNLYELIQKNNVTAFRNQIRERFNQKRKNIWPYKSDLLFCVVISGHKKDIANKDLDNLLKTLFDSLKGIVFEDDSQITKLSAEKEVTTLYKGVMIGIKELNENLQVRHIPYMFSTDNDQWVQERIDKFNQGKNTIFDSY